MSVTDLRAPGGAIALTAALCAVAASTCAATFTAPFGVEVDARSRFGPQVRSHEITTTISEQRALENSIALRNESNVLDEFDDLLLGFVGAIGGKRPNTP